MPQYRIESQWPAWSRWRVLTARPHSEQYPFDADTRELVFLDRALAEQACASFARWNAGNFRVVEVQT